MDGAYCYANEDAVGAGLKAAFEAGVKREDVFIVSKVWCTYQSSPERVQEGVDKTLKSLGVDYVDLMLVVSSAAHPGPPFPSDRLVGGVSGRE